MAKDEQPSDPVAALEARVAEMERVVANLGTRRTFHDANGVERVAQAVERNGERWEYVVRDLYGDVLARYPLAPTPGEAEAQRAREAVEQQREKERHDALAYLKPAETKVRFPLGALRPVIEAVRAGKVLMLADAEELRRALPGLERAVGRVRALVEREPWPEGEERLRGQQYPPQGEAMLADARAVLGQFDALVAAREAARRPRAPAG